MCYSSKYLQVTFQCVLATDGRSSFAIFIYENPDLLRGMDDSVIGFNKGDMQSFSIISPSSIQHTNVYRIDGKLEGRGKRGWREDGENSVVEAREDGGRGKKGSQVLIVTV